MDLEEIEKEYWKDELLNQKDDVFKIETKIYKSNKKDGTQKKNIDSQNIIGGKDSPQ